MPTKRVPVELYLHVPNELAFRTVLGNMIDVCERAASDYFVRTNPEQTYAYLGVRRALKRALYETSALDALPESPPELGDVETTEQLSGVT